jgi:hypothetical protein
LVNDILNDLFGTWNIWSTLTLLPFSGDLPLAGIKLISKLPELGMDPNALYGVFPPAAAAEEMIISAEYSIQYSTALMDKWLASFVRASLPLLGFGVIGPGGGGGGRAARGVYRASTSVAKAESVAVSRGYQLRAERGPGQWLPTFQVGTNMRAEDAAYELSSCGTPRGMGYYVDNVQFENFENGDLLDAKNWRVGGRMANLMLNVPFKADEVIRRQAVKQLAVANKYGVGVQWRVADPQVTDMLRNFMQLNLFPIKVVYKAP